MVLKKLSAVSIFMVFFLCQNIFAQVGFKNINLDEAKKLAQDSNKKIMIYIYSIPCSACTLLVKNIFQDAGMSEYINRNYISIKIRGDKTYKNKDYHTKILEKFDVKRGFPVVMLLESDGKYLERIRGFSDKKTYSTLFKNYTNNIYTMDYYHKQVKKNPKDCEAMVELAIKYHDRQVYDKALKYYESAVRHKPCKDQAINWYAISVFHKVKGNIEKAVFMCEIAVELDPENSQYQSSLKSLKQQISNKK